MLDVVIEQEAIRVGERFAVSFRRTLRIPDDGRTYPLPPGLGAFPIHAVEDFADRVPPAWREPGAAFIPMYQREAVWLSFAAAPWKPNAVKVAVGGINAISGAPDSAVLCATPQDYIVCPYQPWLDGINTGNGSVRQFVAMPLGLGYTVEASLTGQERYGGIQLRVFEPKPGKFPDVEPPAAAGPSAPTAPRASAFPGRPMGLGAGGTMRQKIYPDPHGIDTWDQGQAGRVVIHIVNSAQFLEITGMEPPPTPVDAKLYASHRLPWFDLYDEDRGDIAASARLADVKTVAEHDSERGVTTEGDLSVDISESEIVRLRPGADSSNRSAPP
jgi:hypothetical protein